MKKTKTTTAAGAAALLELLQCMARAMRQEATQRAVEHGLLQVHWQVLWFLRAANRYSNSLRALAAYLGQTKGSVSQTAQLLEKRGYLVRQPDETDRRGVRLALTAEGRAVLRRIDVGGNWRAAAAVLGVRQASESVRALTVVLRRWQQESGGASFGVCRTCAHFLVQKDGSLRCGLTQEALSRADSGKICAVHRVSA